jgi:site-specific recombinase XerD
MTVDFDRIAEQCLAGYGYHTTRAYRADLEHFRDWCALQLPPLSLAAVTATDIRAFLRQMLDEGYSRNTCLRRLAALRRFYRSVMEDGAADHAWTDPTSGVRSVELQLR